VNSKTHEYMCRSPTGELVFCLNVHSKHNATMESSNLGMHSADNVICGVGGIVDIPKVGLFVYSSNRDSCHGWGPICHKSREDKLWVN
jgi:hypothetical protein